MKMTEWPMVPVPVPVPGPAAPEVVQQLGQITRQLHDTLQQLGVMPKLQQSAQDLPDARSRLSYIAHKAGAAADRVLTAVEQAKQERHAIQRAAKQIAQRCGADPARQLPAPEVLAFAAAVEAAALHIDQQLTDIMLAQDFHDLTGQVVAKVVALVIDLEDSLLQLLRQAAAIEPAPAAERGPLNGPVIAAVVGAEVVSDQSEVDALLASLGF
ncbi:MAG: protein phosphatase CheZ [Burkholderiaceae bacterium]|nr:protein phosphatase CheZ [Burkholderiaceae bacterium]